MEGLGLLQLGPVGLEELSCLGAGSEAVGKGRRELGKSTEGLAAVDEIDRSKAPFLLCTIIT